MILHAGSGRRKRSTPEPWTVRAFSFGETFGQSNEGTIAALAIYRLDTIAFVPLNAPCGQLVYNEDGASLDLILSEGEAVMQGRKLTGIDEAAIIAEIIEEHRACCH